MNAQVKTNIEQVTRDYERDGFARVPNFFSREELNAVRREIENYSREVAPKLAASEVTFEADGKTVRNLWRMEKHSSFFDELSKAPDLLDLVRPLVHGNPVVVGVETFNKPARVGSGVPPHQDNAYFCQNPPDVLTVWIAMDAVTSANGPVFYIHGSQKGGLLPHKASGVKGNSIGLAAKYDFSNPFTGLLEPGDALIHHCHTVHFSGPNRTEFPRCGLLVVYRGSHTGTDAKLKEDYMAALALVS
jgi:ectoine hydroxylase-related dioxygenase (phytanoyl-CoA dioxygenase family)